MVGRGLFAVVAGCSMISAATGCRRSTLDPGQNLLDASVGPMATPDVDGRPEPVAGADAGGADATGDLSPSCAAWPPPQGTGWDEVTRPLYLDGASVISAWAAGPDDIFFAAGAQIVRWTRGCWRVEGAPGGAVTSIAGTADVDVWAVAGGAIYHRDAAGWSPADTSWRAQIEVPGRTAKMAVQSIQPWSLDEVWATGLADGYDYYEGTSNYGVNLFMLRWTSGTWRAFTIDEIVPDHAAGLDFYYLGALWVSGHDDVWIGGPTYFIGSTMNGGSVLHYDGTAWKWAAGAGFPKWPAALWGTAGEVWIAIDGGNVSGAKQATLLHHVNDAWTSGVVDVLPWRAEGLHSVWGRGPNDVWAAGADVVHWDGSAFALVDDAPEAVRHMNALVTGDANSVWLVGPGPRFFRRPLLPR
jgi:hypothetical protein